MKANYIQSPGNVFSGNIFGGQSFAAIGHRRGAQSFAQTKESNYLTAPLLQSFLAIFSYIPNHVN